MRILSARKYRQTDFCGVYRDNRVSPLELLGILDLVSDRAGQAVRRFLSVTVDPAVLQIELVLRNVLHAAVMQNGLPPALVGIVLRTRADAPVMLEGGIIDPHDLIADRHSSLGQFLAGFARSAAHLDLHFSDYRSLKILGRDADRADEAQPPLFFILSTLILSNVKFNPHTARAKCRSSDCSVLSPARGSPGDDEFREFSSKLIR